MSDECGYCNEQNDELVDRADLIDPYGEESPETTMVCKRCEHILETKQKHTFVCSHCHTDHDGLMVIHDSFGTYCKTCYNDEGWERPTLTDIPADGWKQSDIGRQVYIRGEHGTIIPDIIICSTLPHGQTCIGPGHTIGGILARMDHVSAAQAQSEEPMFSHTSEINGPPGRQMSMDDFIQEMFRQFLGGDDGDDDEEGKGDLIP